MHPTAGLRFDEAAAAYDRSRPGYPVEMVAALDPAVDTLEIGCGSGQLTVDLVGHGHRVCALDPGPNLIALAGPKCPGAEFVVGRFEDTDFGQREFDLIASGTAFHWVDPRVGYLRAANLLRLGGRLALLSHRLVGGPLTEAIDDVVARCAPAFPIGRLPDAAEVMGRVEDADRSDISAVLAAFEGWGEVVEAGRWFGPADVRLLVWDQLMDAEQLVAAFSATTAWGRVPTRQWDALGDGLRELVAAHVGRIERRRVTLLAIAQTNQQR